MRRPPLTHQKILQAIEKSRLAKRRRPDPWNDGKAPLELYVSPELKERLNLDCKTTTEYLARVKGEL